ncbi:MAG: SDR family oxidoreductase [Rubrivivax sp.]
MDLRVAGRKAIVLASTKGLRRACATSLAREGVYVWINGRSQSVEAAAAEIAAQTGGTVAGVAADITTEAGRARLVAACPDADILVTNNESPKPGRFEDWDHDAYIEAFEANMLAPVLMIRALLPGMRARRFGRPDEFGDLCAYLCSDQASYVCGQNIEVDGGSYRGIV